MCFYLHNKYIYIYTRMCGCYVRIFLLHSRSSTRKSLNSKNSKPGCFAIQIQEACHNNREMFCKIDWWGMALHSVVLCWPVTVATLFERPPREKTAGFKTRFTSKGETNSKKGQSNGHPVFIRTLSPTPLSQSSKGDGVEHKCVKKKGCLQTQ